MNTIGELAYQNILGIRFFTGSAEAAVQLGLEGGLVVVPAAPLLVELATNLGVREAVFSADLAITDSAFMVLLWQLLTGERIPRISGLRYLRLLLATKEFRSSETVFWVMPSAAARDQNLAWLRSQGHDFTEKDCHVAPRYAAGPIVDELLVAQVKSRKPKHIVICLGGGTQERLGFMLRRECDFRPGIHCIGAAIGFLSGNQIGIPPWADRLYLGWLFRCVSAPRTFVPRYWKAAKLAAIMFRYRQNPPALLAPADRK